MDNTAAILIPGSWKVVYVVETEEDFNELKSKARVLAYVYLIKYTERFLSFSMLSL